MDVDSSPSKGRIKGDDAAAVAADSSGHDANTKSKYPEEDISRFKKMMAEANTQYEELSRSDQFLGQRDDPIRSSYHKKDNVGGSFHSPKRKPKKNLSSSQHSKQEQRHGHPWGAPVSPEQFRPDSWLGGSKHSVGSSGTPKRSWTPKSVKSAPGRAMSTGFIGRGGRRSSNINIGSNSTTRSSHPAIPSIDLDDSVHSFATETLPNKSQASTAVTASSAHSSLDEGDADGDGDVDDGLVTPSSSVHTTKKKSVAAGATIPLPRAVAPPPLAESMAKVRAESKTPILEKEKINPNKFLNSFALFERALEATEPQSAQERVMAPKKAMSLMPGMKLGSPAPATTLAADVAAAIATADEDIASTTTGGVRQRESRNSGQRAPRKSSSLIAPRRGARRNFSISPRTTIDDIRNSNANSSQSQQSMNELSNLSWIIENLRKVKLDASKKNGGDPGRSTDQAAAEIMAALRKLRSTRRDDKSGAENNDDDVLGRLRSSGVLSKTLLTQDDIGQLQSIRRRLRKVLDGIGSSNPAVADLKVVDRQLKQVIRLGSDKERCPGTDDDDDDDDDDYRNSVYPEQILEEASDRLSEAVLPHFDLDFNNLSVIKDCDFDLKTMINRIRAKDENDLSLALQQLEGDDSNPSKAVGFEELSRILNGTNIPVLPGENTNLEEDELRRVIATLNRTQLNKWEASKFAGFFVNLRKTNFPENDSTVDNREIMKLRKVVPDEKMLAFDEVLKTLRKVSSNLDDKVFDEIVGSIVASAEGQPTLPQTFQDELANAIKKLRKVKMNQFEAKQISQIMYNLRKTPQQDKQCDDEEISMVELKKVIKDEQRVSVVEDVVKQIKRVRFDLDDDVFEFFIDDIVAMGVGTEAGVEAEDPPPSDHRSSDLSGTEQPEVEVERADSLQTETESPPREPKSPEKVKRKKEKKIKSPSKSKKNAPNNSPEILSSSNHSESSPVYTDDQRKIVFNRKHHWKHKQHFKTVIGEKRWRKEEQFGTDEVIYSPLSREQHDRRKKVSAALLQSMGALDNDDDFVDHTDGLEMALEANGVSMDDVERNAASSKRTAIVQRSPPGRSPTDQKPPFGAKAPAGKKPPLSLPL